MTAKDLKLVLKKHWYDMIDSGEKKEEYRDTVDYWRRRFCLDFNGCYRREVVTGDPLTDAICPCGEICEKRHPEQIRIRHYDTVTFYLGYRKDRPSMQFVVDGITVGHGRKEWGALPFMRYYVIKLGERLR